MASGDAAISALSEGVETQIRGEVSRVFGRPELFQGGEASYPSNPKGQFDCHWAGFLTKGTEETDS